jgi:hypothetical protein
MPLYDVDPNDNKKQIPANKPDGIHRYSYATAPEHSTIQKRPTYVVINQPGEYAFSYSSASATPGEAGHNYITASIVPGDADAGTPSVKLDISPLAWRQIDSAGDVGDVTFVYVRVS